MSLNGISLSTYWPLLVGLLFVFGSGLSTLIVVLCAARWVTDAYRSGPAVIGRLQALEDNYAVLRGEVESGIAEAKALATKRYRADRAKVTRAEKAGTVDQLEPDLQGLLSAPMMQGAPPPNGTGHREPSSKADLRARARMKGFTR